MKKIISLLLVTILILLMFTSCKINDKKTKYILDISLDDTNKIVTCDMKVNYYNNNSEPQKEIVFNMFSNAYRKDAKYFPVTQEKKACAFPNGEKYGNININSVMASSKSLNYEINGVDKNLLTVILDKPLNPNKSITLEIQFAVKLANIRHRLGYANDVVMLGNFYPILAVIENGEPVECPYYSCGDPFYSSIADYQVTLNCPTKYVVGSSGKKISYSENNDIAIYKFTGENIRDFAMAMSPSYHVKTTKVNGIIIQYLYINSSSPDKAFAAISDAMNTYSELFGDYPYDTITVTETPFSEGGMEYPQLVYIASGLESKTEIEVIAHELAHQWWYGVVGNNQIMNPLFDEGMAQYSTTLFFENNPQYNISRESRIDSLSNCFENYSKLLEKLGKNVDLNLMRGLSDYNSEFDYVFTTYVESELFIDSLRNRMGDEAFFSAIKKLYQENKFQEIDNEKFLSYFQE